MISFKTESSSECGEILKLLKKLTLNLLKFLVLIQLINNP